MQNMEAVELDSIRLDTGDQNATNTKMAGLQTEYGAAENRTSTVSSAFDGNSPEKLHPPGERRGSQRRASSKSTKGRSGEFHVEV